MNEPPDLFSPAAAKELKRFVSPGCTRIVRLFERHDGRFYFEESYEDTDDMTFYGLGVYRFWTPGFQSGIFDDLAAAEAELRSVTPWLRDTDHETA